MVEVGAPSIWRTWVGWSAHSLSHSSWSPFELQVQVFYSFTNCKQLQHNRCLLESFSAQLIASCTWTGRIHHLLGSLISKPQHFFSCSLCPSLIHTCSQVLIFLISHFTPFPSYSERDDSLSLALISLALFLWSGSKNSKHKHITYTDQTWVKPLSDDPCKNHCNGHRIYKWQQSEEYRKWADIE